MNDAVYIHEFIDIRGHHRADYLHHMAANWSPHAQEARDQKLFGIWSVLGSTGGWPQVVNLWEERGFDGLASSFAGEAVGPGAQDPVLAEWWAAAAEFRSGGFDRLVVPAAWTPTIDEHCAAGTSGVAYAHEVLRVEAGANWDVLDVIDERGREIYGHFGLTPVGGWATAMVDDDEVIVVWAIPRWEAWAAFEQAHLPGADDLRGAAALTDWRQATRGVVTGRHRILLVNGPLSPLRTGRQPAVGDQRPRTSPASR